MMRNLLVALIANGAALAANPVKDAVPLFFIANQGQAPAAVRFMAKGSGLTAYFSPGEALFRVAGRSVRMQFEQANPSPRVEGMERLPGHANFLIGEPRDWRSDVPLYGTVVYRELYPGIDMFFSGQGRDLKSGFVVAPGADPSRIRLRYAGGDGVRVEESGALVIPVNGQELREQAPSIYQERRGERVAVEGRFALDGDGAVRFLVGDYDVGRPLIIDPVLSYSTLLGGSGSNAATALAVDLSGAAYVAGYTDSYNFPTASPGQNFNAGGNDAFVAKFNSSGNGLVYCTYVGGSADDRAYGIAVDGSGSAYVTGMTISGNFPVRNALQSHLAGERNAFVLKLNPAGNTLVYSTYLGGNLSDNGNGIAVDAGGDAYVVGDTTSINFPATGFQKGNHGGMDAFVAKLSADGTHLVYSTYLGGAGDDRGAGIAVDANGSARITGSTYSTNFPVANAYQSSNGGGEDAFIARLSADGSSLVFSTYLGGTGGIASYPEAGQGIALDSQGNAYVTGVTSSANFPLLGAVQTSLLGSLDAFVAEVSASGTLVYSTYLGGSGVGMGNAIAVDSGGNAYVVGYTYSTDLPVTANALQAANAGDCDAFLAKLSAAGGSLAYLSYLGGNGSDTATAVALDTSGNVYMAGWTLSTNFPLLNPYQSATAANYGAFVTKIIFNLLPTLVGVAPNSGSGASQTFSFQFADANGTSDLTSVSALFNASLTVANGCSVTYNRAQNALSLLTDAGTAPAGTITPGSGSQQNSQCVLNGGGSSVSTAGTMLTLNLAFTFLPAFNGNKNIYMQATNPYGTSAWQAEGTWTANFSITAVSVTPASGTGASQTFSFQFSDSNGAADLASVSVLFNSALSTASACSVTYNRAQNTLALLTDAGAQPAGTITPGSGSQQNSQCVLNGSGSSVSMAGTVLTLNLALTFQAAFSGNKNIYMQATSPYGSSAWLTEGTWTVPVAVSPGVSVVSVTPSSGSGLQQTFAFQYTDSNGATDLTQVWLWFNTGLTYSHGAGSCLLYLVRPSNTLYLYSDVSESWLAPVTLGSSASLGHSLCSINVASSSVTLSGDELVLTLPVTFTTLFSGQKNIYMYGTNGTINSGWQTMGTWTVPAPATPVVSVVSVTPSSGNGAQQTFTSQYSDSSGATDLTQVWLWFNTGLTLSQEGSSCLLYLSRAANQLFLYNDAGSGWLPAAAVGASTTLSNSQCSVAMNSVGVTPSGTNLTLSLAITFSAGFAGTKNIYAYGVGASVNSGWQTMGTWSVPAAVSPGVSVVSVTPSSGSGLQQTFTFQYSDSNGATDLTQVWLWFNTGLTYSHGAGSCLLYLVRPSNTLYLYSDVSESWLAPVTLGSSASLGHSLCSINVASSSVTLSGDELVLTLPVTFTTLFSGQKNIYMYGTNGTINSGWQTMGTWTVPVAVSTGVSVVSVTPSSGSGLQQTFAFQYSDSNGATDLTQVWLWFNTGLTYSHGAGSCLLYLARPSNTLYLYSDVSESWLAPVTLGSSASLGHSLCSINVASSSVTLSGDELVLTLPVTFTALFSGQKNIYMYDANATINSGWQTMGTWTVP
jgi:hypothetical protein